MKQIKRFSTKKVFEGKRVVVEIANYDNSHSREHVIVRPAAVILPITADGEVVLIKQVRTAVGDECLYEIPAGIIDEADYNGLENCEDPDKEAAKIAAIRELKEETGYIAENVHFIGKVYTSPGYTNEKIYLFFADKLSIQKEQELDESESIDVEKVEYEKVMEMIINNEIKDLHTVFALTWYDSFNPFALTYHDSFKKQK